MPAADAIVRIENVVKDFGPLRVLDGVGFDVARAARTVAHRGPAAVRARVPCCAASPGWKTVQGRPHRGVRPSSRPAGQCGARAQLRRDVGMVFQSYNLFPHLTVERNITLALTLREKKEPKENSEGKRAAEVLGLVGLTDKLRSYPEQLFGRPSSRGSRSAALAWRFQPQVMLFDEVTSALDPELTSEVLAVMEDLAPARHDHDSASRTKMGFARRGRRSRGVHAPGQGVGKPARPPNCSPIRGRPEFKQFVGSEL